MNRFPILSILLILLQGCSSDFSNRVYHFDEEIPLKPFFFKVSRVEYQIKDEKVSIKVFLNIRNLSSDKVALEKSRFTLRVGESKEIQHDKSFLENVGIETISFSGKETSTITLPFIISREDLTKSLALIVEKKKVKNRERLTLVQIKSKGTLKNSPAEGEWSKVHSQNWD
jgi:hypothetical protein